MKTNSTLTEPDLESEEEVYEIEVLDDLQFLQEQLADDEPMDDESYSEEGEGIYQAGTVFAEHKGSVFSVAYSIDGVMAASGGEDDLAFIWNTETGAIISKCDGHKDSVTNVSFSYDGSYLASSDMSGFIQVWKIATCSKVWEFETDDINWLLWHSSSNILFAGTSSGEVWMWLIPKGHSKSLCHSGSASECAALMNDGKRLCIGHGDGTIKLLDLKTGSTLHTFSNHSQQITSICSHSDNNLILSGSLDGSAVLSNTHSGKVVVSFNCCIGRETSENNDESDDSVEVVSFCPSIPHVAVTAMISGQITIWDISSQTSRHHIDQKCGTTSIKWHPSSPYFCTAGLDGRVRMYDVRSAELKGTFVGHSETILTCDISKDGSKLITGSDDGTARIFNISMLNS